ncbi:MAG: hypothetical protein HY741_11500, partial [Chloroflexi bacterium]|nr:hypothetical protein [Chloroflexota bacterium]
MILVLVGLIAMVACAPQSAASTTAPSSAQGAAHVIAQQGDLVLELELSKDTFYTGEQGQALVTLRNQGTESVFLREQFLPMGRGNYLGFELVDEKGDEPEPYPWFPFIGYSVGPRPRDRELSAGQVLTNTLRFQIPPWDRAQGHAFTIRALANTTRPTALDLATAPLSLNVIEPGAAQQLNIDFKI